LTTQPGTYALVLRSRGRRSVTVGRLGELDVRPGFYVYVGSAAGPGGLRARVARHCRPDKRRHWHIDHLAAVATIEEVWYSTVTGSTEHRWAATLGGMPGASVPLAGFGSSDCRCPAHLFYFRDRPRLGAFRTALGGARGSADRPGRRERVGIST
jgi:Uri superfamily endonuclease